MPLASSNLMALRASGVMIINYGLPSSSSPSHGSNHIYLMDSLLLMDILALGKIRLRKAPA